MITAHVKISYTESDNPIATPEGTQQMLDFIGKLERGDAHPGVRPIYVAWKDQRPPSGFAFFECGELAELEAFLAQMPNDPAIEIDQVHDLDAMAKRAVSHLAEA